MRLTQLSTLAVALFLATSVAAASEQGHFEKTFQVSGAADLQVYTQSGNITVRPGSAGTVSITGRIHVGDAWMFGLGNNHKDEVQQIESNPPLSQSGNSIRVDYVNRRNISIDYEITAPADTKVRTKSGSGDQTIEGMQGRSGHRNRIGGRKARQSGGRDPHPHRIGQRGGTRRRRTI